MCKRYIACKWHIGLFAKKDADDLSIWFHQWVYNEAMHPLRIQSHINFTYQKGRRKKINLLQVGVCETQSPQWDPLRNTYPVEGKVSDLKGAGINNMGWFNALIDM